MSTQRAGEEDRSRLPSRDEVLAQGRPFPPYPDLVIEELTDEQEEEFLAVITEA